MYEKTETNKTHKSLDLREEEDYAAEVEVDWGWGWGWVESWGWGKTLELNFSISKGWEDKEAIIYLQKVVSSLCLWLCFCSKKWESVYQNKKKKMKERERSHSSSLNHICNHFQSIYTSIYLLGLCRWQIYFDNSGPILFDYLLSLILIVVSFIRA